MANSKPANSLENLLQRKRPAKQRGPQDSWTLDELTNAGGMHGIREFVEQALAADVAPRRLSPPPPPVMFPAKRESSQPDGSEIKRANFETSHLEGSNNDNTGEHLITDKNNPTKFDPSQYDPANPEALDIDHSNITQSEAASTPASHELSLDPSNFEGSNLTSSNFTNNKIQPFPAAIENANQEPHVTDTAIQEVLDSAVYEAPPRRISLRPIRSIQDGLSRNELAALSTLWTKAREGDTEANFRFLTIGDRTLAAVLNVSDNSVRNLRNALLDKLAIQVRHAPVAGPRGGKTYIVFSYAEILRRWRKHGYVLASQRTAGAVALCDASGQVIAPRALVERARSAKFDPSHFKFAPSDFDPSILQSDLTNFAPANPDFDPSSFGPLIRNKTIRANQPPAPDEIASIVRSVATHLGACDEDFAQRLILLCRSTAGDATIEEIAYFVESNLPSLVRNSSVQSKTGVLLSRAAPTFTGESLRQLRAGVQRYRIDCARDIIQHSSRHTPEEVHRAYATLEQEGHLR